MCKKLSVLIMAAIGCVHVHAQLIKANDINPLFKPYLNDTLVANDAILKEQVQHPFTADEVLNKTIPWKNPYPTVLNQQLDGFDKLRVGQVPPKGVFPRVFTAPKEFAAIKSRLQTTQVGQMLQTTATKELNKLHSGQGIMGKAYVAWLTSEDFTVPQKFPWSDMANSLAVEGLLAQINHQQEALTNVGKVAEKYMEAWMKMVQETEHVPGRETMVKEQVYHNASIAKLIDFTAAGINKQTLDKCLQFLVKETSGMYGDGMQLPNHWRRWNHIASALAYPLTVVCLENEKGYDKRIFDRGLEVLQDYLTYTFSEEGMSNEGLTYTFGPFSDDLLLMVAAARRGKADFWGNPHFRNIPNWLIYCLSPNPDALWSSHGDTGSASDIQWLQMMIMKFFFPQDEKLDYLLAYALPATFNKLPDVSAFVFANDPQKSKQVYNAVPPANLPLTFFSTTRGSLIARNKWAKDGIQFQLDARQDMYFQSHDHADRGNFELSAHGRNWVVDGWRSTESKYHSVITIDGRGQGYFATPASWMQYVNKPEATFGVIDYKYSFDWMWLKSPVADHLLGKTVASQWRTGVYADAAQKLKQYYPNAQPQRDPLRKVAEYFSGNLARNPLIWNEDTWPMRLPNFQVEFAFRTAGLVKGKHDYVLIVDDLKKDNQERLYEFLMPMPLDVEVVAIKQLVDVKQESGPLNIGFNTLSNRGIQGEYDILLGDKRMKRNMLEVDNTPTETMHAGRFTPQKGDPQLLVRVLEKTPAPRPNLEPNPRLEVIEKLKTEDMHQFYLRTMDLGKRLVIPARAAQPDFKVLLFPHLSGEELPKTEWNADRTVLKVSFTDQLDVFYFNKAAKGGRTSVRMERNGSEVFSF